MIVIRALQRLKNLLQNHEFCCRVLQIPAAVFSIILCFSSPAQAQDSPAATLGFITPLALFGGAGCAAVFSRFAHAARARNRRMKLHVLVRQESQKHSVESGLDAIFTALGQRVVLWRDNREGQVLGHLPEADALLQGAAFLDFPSWLTGKAAARFLPALDNLKRRGDAFDMQLETKSARLVAVSGRICANAPLVQFQDMTASMREQNARQQKNMNGVYALQTLRNLLEKLDQPVWLRGKAGQLLWANQAWRKAVGGDPAQELLDDVVRRKIAESHEQAVPFQEKVSAVIAGDRHILAVTEVAGAGWSAGFAIDETENDHLRSEMKRTVQGYAETFDQISTAVAIFDPAMKLEFFNQAFARLWQLDPPFFESGPGHAHILDRLREEGRLNEQPDWRRWKEDLFEAYRALTPQLHLWHLPDGRTLRVVANPHPQGGVTWLYEDLTEKLNLEARYNTLIRMQGETLDALSEGVAVFGANGRVRLSNPAFLQQWSLPPGLGVEGTHITQIEDFCAPRANGGGWRDITTRVTGFADERDAVTGRMELVNNDVLDYALVPLPQGQTMLTFVNVTDSVRADRLRNEFVEHVSYELRTPLTNIMGFTDMLQQPAFGALNARQHEYLGYIAAQSVVLLNLVNDILDLATVDAGILELDIGTVDISETIDSAVERLQDRIADKRITVDKTVPAMETDFEADGARIRQVLVNLLGNAIHYAPEGSTVRINVTNEGDGIVFHVHDDGCGIPQAILDSVFKRFSAHAHHGRKPGAGLGLSIVKSLVELHHGKVAIDTNAQSGTTVICHFPARTRLEEGESAFSRQA
ncbi:MAG: Histidine kinase [Candidatus Tokpelaia hoelldobleri]|uniref:histidine kinase n=1 Tax=Candidatus Tokpelaia hoelldobleri TaxID=1902579 RepID=A0A1U9JWK9_9HYPH|nr:MAG: Histidine kinase [Candidatus Tokpelaia hoelldoblerii]